MAWTAPSTWVASAILTAAQMNQQVRDNMLALTTWTPFTPTWTNVTLGTTGLVNTGAYISAGKLVHVKFDLTLGTGGAFTGTAGLDVPITAADAVLRGVGIAEMRDGGSGATLRGALIRQSSTTAVAFTSLDVAGANVTATVPWTWAATDTLAGTFTYEAA